MTTDVRNTREHASLPRLATALGTLVGLAEVAWSYWIPQLDPNWRSVLPGTIVGLARFILIACATGILGAMVGAALTALVLAGRRLFPLPYADTPWRLRIMMLGATTYLCLGWMTLFVLSPRSIRLWTYQLVLALGVIVLAAITLLVCRFLQARPGRSKKAWLTSFSVLLTACMIGALLTPVRQAPDLARSIDPNRPRPNVMLITLDTLRADALGAYGNTWIKTPNLDAFAKDAALFEQAIAQAPTTCPSHATIMTGRYPFEHGGTNGTPMRPELVTLADVLRANNYKTAAFTSATTTRSINSGLHAGFDHYDDSLVGWSSLFAVDDFQHLVLFYLVGVSRQSQIPGNVVTDRALGWLADHGRDPWFCWLHYFDPHHPYGSPPPFQNAYQDHAPGHLPMAREWERYAEDVSFTDHQVGRVIEYLKQAGQYDGTLIIVTSDHGEAFGEEHDGIVETTHGDYLYDTTQHVPLMIKPAGGEVPGRRIDTQVELLDLAVTALDMLGMDRPEQFHGQSLAGLIHGNSAGYDKTHALAFNLTKHAFAPRRGPYRFYRQYAARSRQWKHISVPGAGHSELYDLANDPQERFNVAAEHEDIRARYDALLARYRIDDDSPGMNPMRRLAPGLIEQLRTLGYVDEGEDEK